jgi:hypothetical protein
LRYNILSNFFLKIAIVVATPTNPSQVISYSAKTLDRAELALRCAPFNLSLFPKLAGKVGIDAGYTRRSLSELDVESATNWLIQVGMLRREVDGQGLTDSFRLTPLGLTLIEKWEKSGATLPPASILDRVANFVTHWFRLPI